MANPIPHHQISTAMRPSVAASCVRLASCGGITVRSRSMIGYFGAALQTLVSGNISIYTELCEKAREEALQLMLQHAAAMGANAVVAMRYDANDVAEGVTEVLVYGTAVQVEPLA